MLVRKKCDGCKTAYTKGETPTELELATADGIIKLKICKSCAYFWDKSAEVLNQKRTKISDGD